jgi:tetratricopeptide (TPR) repeat protein
LLAKAQAVTLPVVLLLIDYLTTRKADARLFLEKIPFFALALVFGIIAILAQKADESINPVGISVLNSLFYAQYSIWVYFFKLAFPVNLTCLYTYPFNDDGTVPVYVYLSPLIIPVLLGAIYLTRKKYKEVCFGILFFIVVIFPVLQFLPVGQAIVAERYSYIPYIGLFFIMAWFFNKYRSQMKTPGKKALLNYTGIGVLLLFSLLTWNRTKVWADSVALWTDVMKKDPECLSAYVNRSYMYIQYKQYDLAIKDCDAGLALDSTHYKLYINRGTAYRDMAVYDLALKNFTQAIETYPKSFDTYLDRGILYTDQFNQYDSGIADFRYFLRFRPNDKNGNYNLSVAYYKKQVLDSALFYCKRTLDLSPDYPGAHFVCALVYAARQDFPKAYEHGARAQRLGFGMDQALLDGWRKNANIIIPDLK